MDGEYEMMNDGDVAAALRAALTELVEACGEFSGQITTIGSTESRTFHYVSGAAVSRARALLESAEAQE